MVILPRSIKLPIERAMELTLTGIARETVRAGYVCPCGCTPSVDYERGADVATEGCCCGNQFAVGPGAAATLAPTLGFRSEVQGFQPAWGEPLEAAWLVGPSVHGPTDDQSHDHEREHVSDATNGAAITSALDPVCGMTVELEAARSKGLHTTYGGIAYFFCGKGCKLEFEDDPERYLDPAYQPSM